VSLNDVTFDQADMTDAELGEFLSRPVKVREIAWSVGTTLLLDNFRPYELFFANAFVQKKIANFYLLRCKLVIRLQINATPFHYGRFMMTWNPWDQYGNNILDDNGTTLTTSSYQVPKSQRMRVFVDAMKSQGAQMTLPFVHLENAIRVPEIGDFQEMGQVSINGMTPLYHSNGATDDVTVAIWIHAEDVHLKIPTFSNAFTPQGEDEYAKDGVVSGPASTVASIAGMLTEAPIIGPFAKATELASSAVASIARLFGFSRPIIISEPCRSIGSTGTSLALVDQKDGSNKLALTSKTEVTIDSRTVGLDGTDEMSISTIVCKESYMSRLWWSVSDPTSGAGSCLFGCAVTPNYFATDDYVTVRTAERKVHATALAFGSVPFYYWSGTLIFRFSIIASAYHRGRVRVVYDPHNAGIMNPLVGSENYNVAYQRVIDLDSERDFEIEIPWCQNQPYRRANMLPYDGCRTYTPNFGSALSAGKPDAAFVTALTSGNFSRYHNGYLAVYVLNELTSPSSSDPVTIQVFVKAGKDFELRVPDETIMDQINYHPHEPPVMASSKTIKDYVFVPQGEETIHNDDDFDGAPEHVNDPSDAVIQIPSMTPMLAKQSVFFGETFTSFRTLLKRYNYTGSHTFNENTGLATAAAFSVRQKLSYMPAYAGRDPNARFGLNAFNEVKVVLLTYLSPAYLGYRGAIRRKFEVMAGSHLNVYSIMFTRQKTEPSYITGSGTTNVFGGLGTTNSRMQAMKNWYLNLWGGGATHMAPRQPFCEVENPYYRDNRFSFARNLNTNNGIFRDGSNDDALWMYMSFTNPQWSSTPQPSDSRSILVNEYVAIGEDFSLFWFLNAPSFYDKE